MTRVLKGKARRGIPVCMVGDEMVDWLCLSKLSKCASLENFQQEMILLDRKTERFLEKTKP